MRDILFRGKDIHNNWHIGLLVHKGNAWYISTETGIPTAFEVIPNTIGQYIGLKDKDGNMIFEGDIVSINTYDYSEPAQDFYGKIIYSEVWACFCLLQDSKPIPLCECDGSYSREIIIEGNIYDNPELLK